MPLRCRSASVSNRSASDCYRTASVSNRSGNAFPVEARCQATLQVQSHATHVARPSCDDEAHYPAGCGGERMRISKVQ